MNPDTEVINSDNYFIKIKYFKRNSEKIINKQTSLKKYTNDFTIIFNSLKESNPNLYSSTEEYICKIYQEEEIIIKGFFYNTTKITNTLVYELSLTKIDEQLTTLFNSHNFAQTCSPSLLDSLESIYDLYINDNYSPLSDIDTNHTNLGTSDTELDTSDTELDTSDTELDTSDIEYENMPLLETIHESESESETKCNANCNCNSCNCDNCNCDNCNCDSCNCNNCNCNNCNCKTPTHCIVNVPEYDYFTNFSNSFTTNFQQPNFYTDYPSYFNYPITSDNISYLNSKFDFKCQTRCEIPSSISDEFINELKYKLNLPNAGLTPCQY